MATQPDVDCCLALFSQVISALHRSGGEDWPRSDLTMAQLRALLVLVHRGPMSIGRLAAELGVRLPTASALMERLVRQGLAERREDADDRRRTLARASGAGEDLVVRWQQGRREVLRGWMCRMDAVSLAHLAQGLEALVALTPPHSLCGPARVERTGVCGER
jgi:DNA-binding MarR family transcriptional regulator